MYLKGASEILTKKCTRHVVVGKTVTGSGHDEEVETERIDELASDNITRTIIFYANQTLRTIALCYRDFESWPPLDINAEADEVSCLDLDLDLAVVDLGRSLLAGGI